MTNPPVSFGPAGQNNPLFKQSMMDTAQQTSVPAAPATTANVQSGSSYDDVPIDDTATSKFTTWSSDYLASAFGLSPSGASTPGDLILALIELVHRAFEETPTKALPYSKNVADDSMRATVAGAVSMTEYWGATNTYPAYYSTGAPASMDAREQQRESTDQTFHMTRQRWTFS